MKKTVAIILIALMAAAYSLFGPGFGPAIQTTIRVISGAVSLFSYDKAGKPVFQEVVGEGRTVVVSSRPQNLPETLASAAPAGVMIFYEEAALAADGLPQSEFKRLYTPQEFLRVAGPRLTHRLSIHDIELSIDGEGIEAWASKKMGLLGIPISARGLIGVDPENGGLYLSLNKVQAAGVPFPPYFLTRLELEFQLRLPKSPPIRIVDIQYVDAGAIVTFRKTSDQARI